MVKEISLTLLLGLVVLASSGQDNSTPGYLLQNNGDTLKGYVDHRNLEATPCILVFKTSEEAEYKEYSPLDIKGYFVDGEKYKSAIVDTELSPDDKGNLSNKPELLIERDTVFLKEILGGGKSLHYYKNRAGKNQYYIGDNSGYQLLVYKRYYKYKVIVTKGQFDNNSGNAPIMTNTTYLSQLSSYLQDCPKINSRYENTSYTGNSIKSLIIAYTKCADNPFSFRTNSKKLKLDFGLLIGLSVTSLQFKDIGTSGIPPIGEPNVNFLAELDFENHVGVVPGFFFNLTLPYLKGWSIYNEVTYNSYKSGSAIDNEDSHYSLSLDEKYVRLNNLVQFNYPLRDFAVFAKAGISNSVHSNHGNYISQRTENPFRFEFRSFRNITSKKAFNCGLGASYKEFSIEYRYENNTGKAYVSYIKQYVNKHSFIFSIKI